ncbi:MAG: hypothetical protein MK052_08835 [Alphaproteobacteria bacterium]|nr:hypothetical protein [Alphaproteobacteria bacterium]
MTQKKEPTSKQEPAKKTGTDTPSAKKPTTEIPTDSGKGSKAFLWLLLAGVAMAGVVWMSNQTSTESGYSELKPTKTKATETTDYRPNAPTIKTAENAANDNEHDVQTEISTPTKSKDLAEIVARQDKAKRIRLALREDITALENKVAELTQQTEALTAALEKASTANTNGNGSIPTSLTIDTQPTVEMQTQLMALSDEVEKLQKTYETDTKRYVSQIKLMQALDQITTQIRDGESYAPAMEKAITYAETIGMNDTALVTLAGHANKGVPSMEQLFDDYIGLMETALPVSLSSKNNPNLSDKLRSQLSNIVSIRKAEISNNDDSDEAQLARAEDELEMDNVTMALVHVNQLSDATRPLFKQWIIDAKSYIEVHDALSQLKNALVQSRAD